MELLYKLRVPVSLQAGLFRILARLGIHVHPRDADLVGRFHRNRNVFDNIRTMLAEDSHLGYVGHEKTRVIGESRWRTPEEPGISSQRWDRYRMLLQEVGVYSVSHVGDTITMRVSTYGSSSKGFVCSPAHADVVLNLEFYPLTPEQHAHLILDEPWHVYYGWDS